MRVCTAAALCVHAHAPYSVLPCTAPPPHSRVHGTWVVLPGPSWLLPIKWALQETHYYVFYFTRARSRPAREVMQIAAFIVVVVGALWYLCHNGHGHAVLLHLALPRTFAIVILAFTFDYLPHRPHEEKDKYAATSATSFLGHTETLTAVLLYVTLFRPPHTCFMRSLTALRLRASVPCCACCACVRVCVGRYQNYHIVHHLIPYLPFYEYSRVWFKHKAAMMERGTRIRSLFPIFLAKTTSKTNEQSTTERQQGVRHEKTG